MHIVRYLDGGEPRVGLQVEDTITPLATASTIADVLQLELGELRELCSATTGAGTKDVVLLPPLDGRGEVWCAGVTYARSRNARMEESTEESVYDRVYSAPRPELFGKAPAWRVVTDGEPIGIRSDSGHDVPEPELAVVANRHGEIVGFTVCNDVSSRSIEGENPLYIPQAKVFSGGCALASGIRPAWEVPDPTDLTITLRIRRSDAEVFTGSTSTRNLVRSLEDLVADLFAGNDFPDGVILATGTGIVPELDFTLAEGDVVEIVIDHIGQLSNTVVVGKSAFAALAGPLTERPLRLV